jgi:hypothetical protein
LIQRTAIFVSMLFALSLGACAKAKPAVAPAPVSAYTKALEDAEDRARAGDHSGADRILADFALKAAGTEEAVEISFWRALYMVDPSNKRTSIPEGIRALDIYLSSPGTRWYRAQAEVLRRTAQSVQALRNAAQAQPRVVGRDTVFVTREEEIAALRDQLARANAELDRIKKRLANPSR